MNTNEARDIAHSCGFAITGPLEVAGLDFKEAVRDMCNAEQCKTGFGTNWCCPPALPSIDELRALVHKYQQGILVQTVGQMEDSFDYEAIKKAQEEHTRQFVEFAQAMRNAASTTVLPLGSGPCPVCELTAAMDCSYPHARCRFPDKSFASMEACGLLVSEVCTNNGLKYNHGPHTISFTSCCLF